jgi:hypothetical protein
MPEFVTRISKRAKRISITVKPGGVVTVIVPRKAFLPLVPAFVAKHRAWIEEKVTAAEKRPVPLLAHLGIRDYTKHKEAARSLIHELVERHNAFYGYTYGSIRIGKQSSRWGSCSTRGNLNFNYKILFLPPQLQAYVVVHELCHLKEMNHSDRFWALVTQQVPDWKHLRGQLRKY